MSNLVFPKLPGLAWGVKKTPVWRTNVQTSANGREVRAAYYSYPQWKFTLSFEVLRTKGAVNELETLAAFFNRHKGSFESFLYEDPNDNQAVRQSLGRVIPGKRDYQLLRNIGGFTEPVTALNGRPEIWVGNVRRTYGRDYVIDENTGVLRFLADMPTAEITWSGRFYYRVRFADDSADFENFIGRLWRAKKIELVSVKV